MNKVLIPIIVVVVGVASVFAYYKMRPTEESGVIHISGNIEATTVELSFRIAGWVETRPVDEGMTITTGQLVATLDNAEYVRDLGLKQASLAQAAAALAKLEAGSRVQEIDQARSAMDQTAAALDQLKAGSRPEEIAAAKEAMIGAKAEAERLATDYQRMTTLYQRDSTAMTIQQLQAAKAAWEVAQARERQAAAQYQLVVEGPRKEEIQRAEAAYQQAKSNYELVKIGPRQEDIDQARAQVRQAQEALGLSETRLAYTVIKSPLAGIVLSKSTEPGEFVSPGTPIVTVADLRNVWLRGYVNETDLAKVKLGQTVDVTTDSYPDKAYTGHISFIASEAEFTPKTVQTQKERVKLVFRVKIDLDNRSLELKPGMPADARISIGE